MDFDYAPLPVWRWQSPVEQTITIWIIGGWEPAKR
jgi:hypothetical protein